MPGGTSFVTTVPDLGTFVPQVWEIAFPSGDRHRITNDLNRYIGASVSADARALVTVQQETVSNLWVVPPAGDMAKGKAITTGRGRGDGVNGLSWTPDGRIVFGSVASGRPEVWIVNADGTGAQQLTNDEAPSLQPTVTPDGRFVLFQRFRSDGMDVWRAGVDGSDARALTTTGSAFGPVAGPDGAVYFYSPATGVPTAHRISIDGGTPVKLADSYFRPVAVSPDGTLLLGVGWDPTARRSAVATLPVSGGQPTLIPDIPVTLTTWMPDGKGVTFAQVSDGALTIFAAPLAGGTPKPFLRVQDNVFALAWAGDGRLAVARGTGTSDVVLITRAVRTP
jgi:Tol biopolymer transport system component